MNGDLRIGGVGLRVAVDDALWSAGIEEPREAAFWSDPEGAADASLTVRAVHRSCLPLPHEDLLDARGWRVVRGPRGGSRFFGALHSPAAWQMYVEAAPGWTSWLALINPGPGREDACLCVRRVLRLVMSVLLVGRDRILLHASAVEVGGRGVAFAGRSGTGKSTLAGLLEQACGVRSLSRDRVALWVADESVRASGTIWGGLERVPSSADIELGHVVFIDHGVEQRLHPLTPAAGAHGLLMHSFVPRWEPELVARLVATIEAVSRRVGYHRLEFAPTPGVASSVGPLLRRRGTLHSRTGP